MGNCCGTALSMEWDSEDWSDLTSKTKNTSSRRRRLWEGLGVSPNANEKVKIKISKSGQNCWRSKKWLITSKCSMHASSAEQFLLSLINTRDHDDARHRSWRPELESIPEDETHRQSSRSSPPVATARDARCQSLKLAVSRRVARRQSPLTAIRCARCSLRHHPWSDLISMSKKTSSRKVFDEANSHGYGLGLQKVQKEELLLVPANGKVKIKISKKDLLDKQQQLNNNKIGRASAEQFLLRLMNARCHYADHRRFWDALATEYTLD
ncbi:hypothetical protein VNO78_22561 [Psophocarpus tetragonolobus]|uniref:Uncharacterized protein n=1 Tax=Psophocarpus tetragonolobus TaxID=3891 RepID=A0AAN9S1U4_PSOTE